MLLENDKIKLRALEPEDVDLLYNWENNPHLWQVGNTRQPYSKFALRQYIQQAHETIYEAGHLRLIVVEIENQKAVGTVDLFDFDMHNSKVALGLYIDAAYQGKGYATQALHLIEEYVFNFLKLHQLYCHISENNTASRTMFEKEGYEQNGMLKNWIRSTVGYDNIIVFQRFND